jgi:hypothetical protein
LVVAPGGKWNERQRQPNRRSRSDEGETDCDGEPEGADHRSTRNLPRRVGLFKEAKRRCPYPRIDARRGPSNLDRRHDLADGPQGQIRRNRSGNTVASEKPSVTTNNASQSPAINVTPADDRLTRRAS